MNPAFVCASNTRDLASFRGRVGWATGPVLLYGTGGGAYANTHYTALTPLGVSGAGSTGFASTDRWGYAAVAGIEWGFKPNWSAKDEYMHYGFDNVTVARACSGANSAALGLNIDTVKVGVNPSLRPQPCLGPLLIRAQWTCSGRAAGTPCTRCVFMRFYAPGRLGLSCGISATMSEIHGQAGSPGV